MFMDIKESDIRMLTAVQLATAECFKRIPPTRRNRKLLTRKSKFLGNKSPLELMAESMSGSIVVLMEYAKQEAGKDKQ